MLRINVDQTRLDEIKAALDVLSQDLVAKILRDASPSFRQLPNNNPTLEDVCAASDIMRHVREAVRKQEGER